jgi:hypothetical protein
MFICGSIFSSPPMSISVATTYRGVHSAFAEIGAAVLLGKGALHFGR